MSICNHKRNQMKKLPTTKFITFRDLQLWFWSFIHPKSFEEFEFQMWENPGVVFLDRWFQMKKLWTKKVHNFSTSTSFVLVVSPSEVIWKKSNFKCNFRWIDDFKCKSCQLQRCICFWDPQLLLWSLLHPRSFTMSAHTLVTIEHRSSFGMNSIKSCESNISASKRLQTKL